MFGLFKKIARGTKFDNKVKKDFGIKMVQILHEMYDDGLRGGTVSNQLDYTDFALIALNELIKEADPTLPNYTEN